MLLDACFELLCFAPQLVVAERLVLREKLVDFGYDGQDFLHIFLRLTAPE
jgi:hypothetical protein